MEIQLMKYVVCQVVAHQSYNPRFIILSIDLMQCSFGYSCT
jgi:hypothetical protein